MTRPLPAVTSTESPSGDRYHSITRRSPPHGTDRISGWEQRAREADERAREADERVGRAELRAVEAEARAAAGDTRIEALLRALESRAPIDQAKGVLMGTFGLSADGAFETLVWVSQNANLKIVTVVGRFLAAVHEMDLDDQPREKLTLLLGGMGRSEG